MGINVSEIDKNYDFEVNTVSYIGRPADNTVMYLTKKAEKLLDGFSGAKNCLVFVDSAVNVPQKYTENNCFVRSDNPCLSYTRFLSRLMQQREAQQRKRRYTLTDGGYYLGENVTLGKNCYIEPSCLIGHDVVIGDDAVICAGAVIKNAVIGNDFYAGENCAVGVSGYVLCRDENGDLLRIPTFGKVIIGDHVQMGAHDNVAMGTAGNTVIEDCVKMDALVYIGHDTHLHKNVELPAGAVIGGYCELNEHAFVGFNATLRNRISLGENTIVGMGSAVIKSVGDNLTVVGNPARFFSWSCRCGRALKDDLICPECGRRYMLVNDLLTEIKE